MCCCVRGGPRAAVRALHGLPEGGGRRKGPSAGIKTGAGAMQGGAPQRNKRVRKGKRRLPPRLGRSRPRGARPLRGDRSAAERSLAVTGEVQPRACASMPHVRVLYAQVRGGLVNWADIPGSPQHDECTHASWPGRGGGWAAVRCACRAFFSGAIGSRCSGGLRPAVEWDVVGSKRDWARGTALTSPFRQGVGVRSGVCA